MRKIEDLVEAYREGCFVNSCDLKDVIFEQVVELHSNCKFLDRYLVGENQHNVDVFKAKYFSVCGVVRSNSDVAVEMGSSNFDVNYCCVSIIERVFYQVVRDAISLCYNSGESSVIESILMYFITYVCGLSNQGYRTWISMYLSCHCDIVDKLDSAFPGCFTEKELKFLKRFHVDNKFAFDIAEEFNVTTQNVDCVLTCCYSKIYRAILIYYRGLFKEVV